jgi:hypothetical protein
MRCILWKRLRRFGNGMVHEEEHDDDDDDDDDDDVLAT